MLTFKVHYLPYRSCIHVYVPLLKLRCSTISGCLNRTKTSYLHHKGDCSVSSAPLSAVENGAAVSSTHAGIGLKMTGNSSIDSVAVAQGKFHGHWLYKTSCDFYQISGKNNFLSYTPESSRLAQHFSRLVCLPLTWQQAHHRLA